MSSCPFSKVPGKPSLPIFGDTIAFITEDPINLVNRKRSKYGDVFKINVFNEDNIAIIKPDATKWILLDHSKDFDSKEAWDNVLGDLFPNGLMLMDGKRHKAHRSVISQVFKKVPMEGYLDLMIPLVNDFIDELDNQEYKMFPLFKELTLKVALKVFFGLNPKDKLDKINTAITNIVKASASLHIDLPFTTYGKGIRARKYLINFFSGLINDKRENPGDDLFSKLCHATNEDGLQFNDEEVIDHLIFILMAAHDTTASTLSSLSYFLSKNPEWQEKIRKEGIEVIQTGLDIKALRNMEDANLAVKETLRIYPPLTSVGRMSNKDLTYGEWSFPKGTRFSIPISYYQQDNTIWENPQTWNPMRFSPEEAEDKKCPYAYSPFGAGLHFCIGYQFAEMQINLVMSKILEKFELVVPLDYKVPMKAVPLNEPKDGLPMRLKQRR